MQNDLIRIAISPSALAPLIKNGSIHAVDFQCLDAASKKTVWALLLSTLNPAPKELLCAPQPIMCDNDKQEVLLTAIEYLKTQYACLQAPCIALYISRYYRLLSLLDIAKNKQEDYAKRAKSWLNRYISSSKHSHELQNQLNDFVQLCKPNFLPESI